MTAQQNVSTFQDPYSFDSGSYKDVVANKMNFVTTGPARWFADFMGQDVKAQQNYLLTQNDRAYERASIESARAWSEYMDNTQYQRMVKDLEKAGLNPWLAVQNGVSGSGAPSVDTGGTAQNHKSSGSSGSGAGILRGLLLLIAGLAAKNPKVAAAGGASMASTASQYNNAMKSLGYSPGFNGRLKSTRY